MEIELRTRLTYYSHEIDEFTVLEWKRFWRRLCDMAYYRMGVCEELIVLPKNDSDAKMYMNGSLKNETEIHFDTVWKEYSYVGDALVVPELKKLYVPCDLFVCAGIWSFMKHCFPNCKLVFWE